MSEHSQKTSLETIKKMLYRHLHLENEEKAGYRRKHRPRHVYSAEQEEAAQQFRLDKGIDPSVDEIYNVLCPAIRAKWSKEEENLRRAPAHQSLPVDFLCSKSVAMIKTHKVLRSI